MLPTVPRPLSRIVATVCGDQVPRGAVTASWHRHTAVGLAALLLATVLAPGPVRAQGTGHCEPRLTQQLDATEIVLGESVGVAIQIEPGCSTASMPRHYMLALAGWPDAASTTAAADMARTFVHRLTSGSRAGVVLGDEIDPRMVDIGRPLSEMDALLATFHPATQGTVLANLVRAAHNSYGQSTDPLTGISTLPAGRRHIVVISHAGVPLGRESLLQGLLDLDRELAIEVNLICVGGGCTTLEGMQAIDVPDIAAAGQALAALGASPAITEVEQVTVRTFVGSSAEYVFGSAAPAASRLGREALGSFVSWQRERPVGDLTLAYRVRPVASGSVIPARMIQVEGITSAGYPVSAAVWISLAVQVRPRPDQPSACGLRAATAAGPDPVDLGASTTVTLTLMADCPPATRDVDVVLAIDRSASMLEGPRLDNVKAAARALVQHIDLTRARVAVIAFGTRVTDLSGLTNDRASLLTAIDGITAEGETSMARGIGRAREILNSRRPTALPVIVLLSDGVIHDRPQPEADWAFVDGIRLFAVCVNAEAACNKQFRQLASPPSYYLATTDPWQIERFYGELGTYLGRADFARLAVAHTPFAIFTYTQPAPGYGAPQVSSEGVLTWVQADPLFGQTQLAYRLLARGPGRWPVAESLVATWRDSDGNAGVASLPIPEVTVVAPPDEGPCRADHLERRAEPNRLPPGATLTTTVAIDLTCSGSPVPLEIALVVDHSYSMRGQRLADTRTAVDTLLAETVAPDARFALVAFSNVIMGRVPLTSDRAVIHDTLAQLAPNGETNIGLAINTAGELLRSSRPGARRFMVLLTDGYNSVGSRPIGAAAEDARELGIEIIAVCAGGVCDPALKTAVTQPSFYLDAPDGAALVDIYRRIAVALSGTQPVGLVVEDQTGPALTDVPGSEVPPRLSGPNPDVWTFAFPGEAGNAFTRRLTARRPGRHPATLWTRVAYNTADGGSGTVYVPPIAVTIEDTGGEVPPTALPWPTITPTPTPTRTPTATPSPTVTPTPEPAEWDIFLPSLCQSCGGVAAVADTTSGDDGMGPRHAPIP